MIEELDRLAYEAEQQYQDRLEAQRFNSRFKWTIVLIIFASVMFISSCDADQAKIASNPVKCVDYHDAIYNYITCYYPHK